MANHAEGSLAPKPMPRYAHTMVLEDWGLGLSPESFACSLFRCMRGRIGQKKVLVD